MRIAAIIFTILGMIGNFSISWILGVIGLIVGIGTIISLGQREKYVPLGIFALIFTGLLGGIFYLCWDGN